LWPDFNYRDGDFQGGLKVSQERGLNKMEAQMTDTVKMPDPVILGMTEINFNEFESAYGYTEAQMKQYGDDRAREALEMAAKSIESAGQSGSYLSKRVRALAKEIK
jgi:hypothetical protein